MFLISATFGQELWAKDGKVCFFLYRESLPCVEINGLCIAPLRIRFESGFPVFVPEPWSAK